MKRLSPAPQLGPSSDRHTSYYSESVVRESYFGSPRAASIAASLTRNSILDDQLRGDPFWSECPQPFSWASAASGDVWSKIPPGGFLTAAGPEEGLPTFGNPWESSRVSELPGPFRRWSSHVAAPGLGDGGAGPSSPSLDPRELGRGCPSEMLLGVSPRVPLEHPPRSSSAPGEPRILPSSGEDLRVRRRDTGGTESSKVNGLPENKLSEDFLGSSSGYSSEDDYVGRRRPPSPASGRCSARFPGCWGGDGK